MYVPQDGGLTCQVPSLLQVSVLSPTILYPVSHTNVATVVVLSVVMVTEAPVETVTLSHKAVKLNRKNIIFFCSVFFLRRQACRNTMRSDSKICTFSLWSKISFHQKTLKK